MFQKSEVHDMTQRKKFTPEFKAQVALEIKVELRAQQMPVGSTS